MDIYGTISQRGLHPGLFSTVKFAISHLLNLFGLLVFWLFMVALLASPVWVPALVNQFLTH